MADGLSLKSLKTLSSNGHVRSHEILKTSYLLYQKIYGHFQGSIFKVRGCRLPKLHTKWKIQIKIQIFIFQDFRITKVCWKDTISETWSDQTMLRGPHRFSVLVSPHKFSVLWNCYFQFFKFLIKFSFSRIYLCQCKKICHGLNKIDYNFRETSKVKVLNSLAE